MSLFSCLDRKTGTYAILRFPAGVHMRITVRRVQELWRKMVLKGITWKPESSPWQSRVVKISSFHKSRMGFRSNNTSNSFVPARRWGSSTIVGEPSSHAGAERGFGQGAAVSSLIRGGSLWGFTFFRLVMSNYRDRILISKLVIGQEGGTGWQDGTEWV